MRSRLATLALATALLGTLTACETVREASNTASNAADKATVCVQALELANFTPSSQDLDKTAEDAKKTVDELNELSHKTADQAVKDAINDMSAKINELAVPDLNPANITAYAKNKIDAFAALTNACL
ncbi:bacteriophage spanin2 family protein [Actinokineospora enzanensis]|uniref:bacteriophage spanin2 family protein n=1 Tax=Actinokineospora enzanensis TaxID=155975 RepID=UPI000379A212|nr:bacteriophage spanin2 family protein [Actinokineospora enzanensis]